MLNGEMVYFPIICNYCGEIKSIQVRNEPELIDDVSTIVISNGWIMGLKNNKSVVYCCETCEKLDRVEDEI
jgi:hypothetical protein